MDIGFAIGSIMRLQVPRVRMENGWALGKFAGEFAQARRLALGSSNMVYFCEPTLRTQLHMSVCGRKAVVEIDLDLPGRPAFACLLRVAGP